MKITIKKALLGTCFLALGMAGSAIAQDEEESLGFTYATYLYCDSSNEAAADKFVAEHEVPVMDKLVKDGVINRWGWMRHHTGGEWRRIRWFGADSVVAALNGVEAMGEALDKALGDDAGPGVGASCKSHEDYIWQVQAGTVGKDRGTAGMSVYFSCKISDEERADEIMKESFAPIYDKLVEDGKLTSWGWQSHVIGGWFRRLQTMTAKDFDTLIAARGEALEAMYGEDNEAGAEFAGICGPHHDYLWEVVHETSGAD